MGPGNGKTCVLVVDDNVELAENVAEILSLRGFVTLLAESAEEALPMALAEGVGVLITDFRLPGMSGAELVAQVRHHRGDVRTVVMSAYTDGSTADAVRAAGANAFLPKPIDFSLLGRVIDGQDATS
jgi:two-component system C4-dicarboxylate transport response regulator DctD